MLLCVLCCTRVLCACVVATLSHPNESVYTGVTPTHVCADRRQSAEEPTTSDWVCLPAAVVATIAYNRLSPAPWNKSSLFMYTCRLLTALCLVRFIISLIGTPRSLLDVT